MAATAWPVGTEVSMAPATWAEEVGEGAWELLGGADEDEGLGGTEEEDGGAEDDSLLLVTMLLLLW